MPIKSLKFKYIAAAFAAAFAAAIAGLVLITYQNRIESRRLSGIAAEEYRTQLTAELRLRAAATARYAAEVGAPDVATGDANALKKRLGSLLDDPTVQRLTVRNTSGVALMDWSRGGAPDGSRVHATASHPVRTMVEAFPGADAPRTVGSVELNLVSSQVTRVGAGGAARLELASRRQLRNMLLLTAIVAGIGTLLSVVVAWWAARLVVRPLVALRRSTERMAQGDFSRPIDAERHDDIGSLQQALEFLRQRLRQSTVSKNYVHSVLSSMTDAVFVTSPDGVIRIANQAACKLLGYAEEELVGKSIVSILEDEERRDFELLQASNDTFETVVRTRQDQTIPVSMTGSPIASEDPQYQGIIFVARNITDRKRAERRIRYLARYDALTKVPNRMQFQHLLQQAIARALRSRHGIALLYLDMDRFKEVNDTFGHSAGDRTLEILSERLVRAAPKEAVVGRLAGDEFALFIDGLPHDADYRGPIAQLARSVLNEVGKAFQLSEHEVVLTASIGIAFCPRDAENVIDLIRNADAAMYHSKQNGGNTFAFYQPEMNAAAVERLMLKGKLRRAIERDEFVIHYQPKVDLRKGEIIGAEALLRWRLPGHGDIPPSQFIPLAEESNLILEIGEWVLNRVCLDYLALQREVGDPGRISLNLSLRQLRQASFILRFRSLFRRHAVSPTAFELEITETTLMADSKRTLRLLDELYAMGLHLSIDDFGTGYSSLSALQQFPISTLKIDQSFVQDITEDAGDATIVRTIIEMGRSLGMSVVAEGVESVRQLEFLREHNCPFGQGRLFGEACSTEEFAVLLKRQKSNGAPFAHLLTAQHGEASRSA